MVLLLLDPTQGEWPERQQERFRLDTGKPLPWGMGSMQIWERKGRQFGSLHLCPLRSLNQSRESLAWGGTCPPVPPLQ